MTGTMAPGAFRKSAAAVSDKPSSADLSFYGITEETYAELVRKFRAVNKDGSGEIGLQVGAWTLCSRTRRLGWVWVLGSAPSFVCLCVAFRAFVLGAFAPCVCVCTACLCISVCVCVWVPR